MINVNDFKQVQKFRIQGTLKGIQTKLDRIDVEQIPTRLFVKTKNEYAASLLEN